MTIVASRAQVASSYTVSRGGLVNESYSLLSAWDFSRTVHENFDHAIETNRFGAKSDSWREIVKRILHRRFDPEGRDRPLVFLAQRGCALEIWKPLLLWHITRDEFLLRDFLINWLYPTYEAGTFRVRNEDVYSFVRTITARGGTTEHAWKDSTVERAASGLLSTATDFGLLIGATRKEFTPYHMPDQSLIYLLHAIRDATGSAASAVTSEDWRMYLVSRPALEIELLRLHQFHKVRYEVAGSLVQLTLPHANLMVCAEGMVG